MFKCGIKSILLTVPAACALCAGSVLVFGSTALFAKGHGGGHHGGGHHGGGHHGGHHHGGHHHGNHGHHHWHHSHHNDWWHHGSHPGWEHNHYSHWNAWHHPWHDWYWYGAGATGLVGLGLMGAEAATPGYYYDPNYYYLDSGTPSIEYENDEPNNQPPSSQQPMQPQQGEPKISLNDAKGSSAHPLVKDPGKSALIDDEKDFEDVDNDDEGEDDDDDDLDDEEENDSEKLEKK